MKTFAVIVVIIAKIVDYFKIFINEPKNILARAHAVSSYKQHNTVKFLIGIIPLDVISYISKAWR